MLHLHVVIANHRLSDFVSRVSLAGHVPAVLADREFQPGETHAVIGIARINETAARVLVSWLRADSEAKSVTLDWYPAGKNRRDKRDAVLLSRSAV